MHPQRKNKYYKTRGARAAAVRANECKSVVSPKSSCISQKEKNLSTEQLRPLLSHFHPGEMRLQFISQSKAETSFSFKKKRKKRTKREKKATMSPAFPSAWFMEMHLPIFFPPIIGKYSNKSENVRQFCYQLVGYPNTLSSEKPRDVTVTWRNITRVEGWPKKGGAIKITITHFQHRMEDHHTEMRSLLSWLYLDHSIFQIDFFGGGTMLAVSKQASLHRGGSVACVRKQQLGKRSRLSRQTRCSVFIT